MRALRLEAFHDLRVVSIPDPAPGPDEVLLEVAATGICGSDVHGFTGANGRRHPGQVMGHEASGRIIALGAEVDPALVPLGAGATFSPFVLGPAELARWAGREQHCPARRLIGTDPGIIGAFAERMVVPARNLALLPEDVPLHLGALVEPLAVAMHAVRRGLADLAGGPGDPAQTRVLVLGGGPIGQSVVLALAASLPGAASTGRVLISEPDADRRDLCARLGAEVLDPARGPILAQLAARGGPVDLAIDAVGLSATLADALGATRPEASIVLVGMGAQELRLPAYEISTRERSIRGAYTYSAAGFAEAAAWAGAQGHSLDPLVSRRIGLDEAPQAFAELAAGGGPAGKILVEPGR
ncbi:zinc-dependent alcohol dehydrogenase [Brachybacterium hainanense]|uniref:Zinc-binding dehydrogenase n=1 Tax=Brachybacterium hainanense TaxID=1541174 RepID=A0ABV6RFU3_9MICO